VALLLGATSASAAEVWKSADEAWLLEGSGFYKPYASWLVLPASLVSGTQALQSAVDGARLLVPPEQAAALPTGLAAPSQVGLVTNTLRLAGRLSWRDKLELTVAWQVAAIVASSASFAASSSSSYLGASLIAPQRRLVDFSPYLVSDGGLLLQHNLDRLAVKYAGEKFSLTVGRQVLSWGTGHLWNPTDLVSPFAPTDIDREVRRGADAVRLSVSLGATSQLEVLWLPQQKGADHGGILRGRTNLFGWDFSATVAKYVSDLVFGADFSGDLGPLGAHGEAAWTVPMNGIDDGKPLGLQLGFVRAVGGLDWRPSEKWVLGGEYYFNGFGAQNDGLILERLRDPRVVRGEIFGAGRHYAGLVATWLATELLTLNVTALVNCSDPSVTIIPVLEYSFEQHVLLRAGGFIPLGMGVDVATLQALNGNDVATNSPAWQRASSTLAARSEYGLSPLGVFVQVGLYLN
jgi:hypothetical protein